MVLQVGMAHLEFSQCEASSETHTMSVNKREQVAVSLDLLSLLREAILVKPALRSELVRILVYIGIMHASARRIMKWRMPLETSWN